ncbi:MAG: fibro-slime domain-containing protein [Planctomycetota bacterium]|jgi:fibro-slime domain-containing protein
MQVANADRRRWIGITVICVGLAAAVSGPATAGRGGNGPGHGDNRETIELVCVVRDFPPEHVDFDVVPPEGFGQYMWNIATQIGDDAKPVYVGGGYKVLSQAHDAAGRPICWTLYDPDLGDTPAQPDGPDTGSIASAESFAQWFQEIPGVNMSTLVTVIGTMQEDGEYEGMYQINIPQFYPIDGLLLGNDADHNNFFTLEIAASFAYDASAGYQLMFKSDDDAWVFLDDRLISDLGGINGSAEQWVDIDRLGLVDGQTYRLRFFKADRSDASSRLHLVTNIPLTAVVETTILAAYD